MPLITGSTTTNQGKIVSYEDSWEFEPKLLKYLEKTTLILSSRWVFTEQVHDDIVAVIDKNPLPSMPIMSADAVVTNLPDTLLLTKHADCVPIMFYDPKTQSIGLAHSGFKGTVKKIAQKTVQAMQNNFQSNPQDLQVFLGPCARSCCYTFSDITIFDHKPDWQPFVSEPKKDLYHIDMPGYIIHTLTQTGVPEKNIQDQGICTIHDDNYYSWRYNKSHHKPLELGVSYIGVKS